MINLKGSYWIYPDFRNCCSLQKKVPCFKQIKEQTAFVCSSSFGVVILELVAVIAGGIRPI